MDAFTGKCGGRVPTVDYPAGAKLYKVGDKGDMRLNGRTLLSRKLQGEYLWFREENGRAEKRIIRID